MRLLCRLARFLEDRSWMVHLSRAIKRELPGYLPPPLLPGGPEPRPRCDPAPTGQFSSNFTGNRVGSRMRLASVPLIAAESPSGIVRYLLARS